VGTEVATFRAGYWSEEVFLDADRSFFLALGGGTGNTPHTAAGFLAMVANPFTKSRAKGSYARAGSKGIEGNFTGEGMLTGGVYVVRQDGKAAYRFLEEDHGDHAVAEDVIEGVKAAVKGEEFVFAPKMTDEPSSCRKTWREWAGRTDGPDGYVFGDISKGLAQNAGCSIM